MRPSPPSPLSEPVTRRMHQDFTRLTGGLTVGEASQWLRQHPPPGRVIYFYVVDDAGRLCGVLPTRRLLLSPVETPLSQIMVAKTVALPADATALDACEFFIQYRLLAIPVVDEQRRILGVVDLDRYTNELVNLDRSTPVGRLIEPIVRFLHIESAGGLVLLACTVVALILANIPILAVVYDAIRTTDVGFRIGHFHMDESLLFWIDDGLMALFFFVVGLEIKREIVAGELSDPRKALLPVVAAVGGMVVPAGLYLLVLWGRPGTHGWGVPMATDIAFVVGFLTLLGPRVPNGLKVLLLTLAIADDIGAVLVIAVAYSEGVRWVPLLLSGVGLALVPLLWWLGVRGLLVYGVLAVAVWLGFHEAHVHPTVAGVLLGLLTPARSSPTCRAPFDVIADLFGRLRGIQPGTPPQVPQAISPAEQLEGALHPWVAFVIMPIFALANAGVQLHLDALITPLELAVAAGLVLGKPLGIALFSWASVRLRLTRLPEGMNWRVVIGAGCLGGIGFTMSLFIAGLAFKEPELIGEAKVGILVGSALAAVLGCGLLWVFLTPRRNR